MPFTYDLAFDQSAASVALTTFRQPVPAIEWSLFGHRSYDLTVSKKIVVTVREERRDLTVVEQRLLASALRASSELLYEF